MTLAIALGLLVSANTLAQGPSEGGPGPAGSEHEATQWSIGIAAISTQKPFKDIDLDTVAFPFISVENKYLRWFGPTLDIKLPSIAISEDQQFNFNIALDYDFGGYDKSDTKKTPILNGMGKRSGGLWSGIKLEWKNRVVDLNAEWMKDMSGNSDGQRYGLGVEKTWMIGQHIMLTPHAAAVSFDEKYVDYYYGVRSSEALAGRPEYLGESSLNVKYGLRAAYMFNMNNSVFIDIGATSFADGIKNSPLVDSSTESSAFLVYMYSF